ncbi:MAG: FAD-binding oxidoreductase [Myxococcales bacterium]|nr:FAD-binding oxidoreductase [Myxococcales bacterium]
MTESWGRYPAAAHVAEFPLAWRSEARIPPVRPVLAYGRGRSYGDSCLNDGGALLRTSGLDRFISFAGGVVRCEAGVTLGEILEFAVPRGYFLPVVPGTKHVSIGGAIANDIHGKNHHRAGTFGRHVRRLELLRSDGSRKELTPGDELFAATVGGLGLTGLITWAEIALRAVPGPAVRSDAVKFAGLDEFFAISDESDAKSEYTVAWLDVLSREHRGIFYRGDHAAGTVKAPRARVTVPIDLRLVNGFTVRAFNAAYYLVQRTGSRLGHYDPFFFPLDAVERWNRLYGKRGFLQFQCVVPGPDSLKTLLDEIVRLGAGSPMTVLKKFGDLKSPGMLSFPRPGFTVAIDISSTEIAAFTRLEEVAVQSGGALYPAKDARMSAATFAKSYPRLDEFRRLLDPAFSSSFWRRVAP